MLDNAAKKVSFDLIADYAAAIPVEVVGNILGVPHADRSPLRDWSLAILGALEPFTPTTITERGNRAVVEFSEYLANLINDRRRHPSHYSDDVMARLIAGSDEGNQLSDIELIQNCIFILNAGHETTTNLIGNGIAALFEHNSQLRELRKNPKFNQFSDRRVLAV